MNSTGAAQLDASETTAIVARWQGRMRGDVRKFDASNERGSLDQGIS